MEFEFVMIRNQFCPLILERNPSLCYAVEDQVVAEREGGELAALPFCHHSANCDWAKSSIATVIPPRNHGRQKWNILVT
jgi:hypothetical protein